MAIPTNHDNIIDSREVIDALTDDTLTADERSVLEALNAEGESLEDWAYGVTLVHDDYFVDYARELADDCGLIKDDAVWPATCIDWERAARELQMDYTPVEFDGVTYWAR